MGRLAYRYRGTDPNHRDNIGLKQAMNNSIPLIYFFGIEKGHYLFTWPVFIVGDDPQNLTFNVSIEDMNSIGQKSSDLDEEFNEGRRKYVTTITLRRLHQQKFRSRVIKAYRNRCAVCRLRQEEHLDVAHIVPDSAQGENL